MKRDLLMLITSRSINCPVCGAAHATCGGHTTTRPVDECVTEVGAMAGPLVRVEVRPGVLIKMTPAQAEAFYRDHPAAEKMIEPTQNKMRRTAPNKGK